MIQEVDVLFWIEQLQQSGRRVSLVTAPQFVDLIDEDKRVFRLRLFQTLNDFPRHGSDVGPAVTLMIKKKLL